MFRTPGSVVICLQQVAGRSSPVAPTPSPPGRVEALANGSGGAFSRGRAVVVGRLRLFTVGGPRRCQN